MFTDIEIKELYLDLKRYGQLLKINTNTLEDVIQDTLERALVSFKTGDIKTYCFQILRNRYFDICKHEEIVRKNFVEILEYNNPSQEYLVAFKEATILPDFDLALNYAVGFNMHDMGTRSVIHRKLHEFFQNKDKYL
jgi:DNA-directed RNA polymerase specialized sigma24 family protein